MKHNYIWRIFPLFMFFTSVFGQSSEGFSAFTNRTFYKPFISEISSTVNQVGIGSTTVTNVNNKSATGPLTEIHLGMDAPILYNSGEKFKWAMSLPVSLHVLWAPLEETTAPIVNNDYRFGLTFTGITYLDNDYVKNLSFKFTPLAHESTHLGDEISIYGNNHVDDFYRVNVSYEYYEFGVTVNDPDTLDGDVLSLKLGMMGLWNPSKGYYTFYEEEIKGRTFYSSERYNEFYLELNYRRTAGFMASKTWQPTLSVEARNRVMYAYETQGKEDRVWCYNAYLGYDYTPRNSKNIKSVGHYLRYYNGVTPHGQFRNTKSQFIGYTIVAYY